MIRRKNLVGVAVGFLLTLYFVFSTRVVPKLNEAFSTSLAYRFQTEALLKGHLSLPGNPGSLPIDWILGRGIQQNWGLGIPFLRLPFEFFAKKFGYSAFPDRFVFVLLYLLTACSLYYSFSKLMSGESFDAIIAISWTSVFLLSPVLFFLVKNRFAVYEEAVAYQCLWSILGLALLLRVASRPSVELFFLISLQTAFGIFIRPTGIFYGITTFVMSALFLKSSKRVASGILLFAATISGFLLSNQLRFGRPFEMGYALSQSGDPYDEFSLRFGYPYEDESLLPAAKELFSALFLARSGNGKRSVYSPNLIPNQSKTFRFRHLYFDGFGWFDLVCLLSTFFIAFYLIAFKSAPLLVGTQARSVLALWSVASFTALSIFYLRAPTMTSRYVADFAPAVSAAVVACLAFFKYPRRFEKFGRIKLVPSVLVVFYLIYFHFHPGIRPAAELETVSTMSRATKLVGKKETFADNFPDEYICGSPEMRELKPIGWDPANCYVGPITVVLFKSIECLFVSIQILDKNFDPYQIKVKAGTEALVPVGPLIEPNGTSQLTYCLNQATHAKSNPMASVAWLPKHAIGIMSARMKLLSISVTQRPIF